MIKWIGEKVEQFKAIFRKDVEIHGDLTIGEADGLSRQIERASNVLIVEDSSAGGSLLIKGATAIGTNQPGGGIGIFSGRSTGNATSSNIILYYSVPGSSGSSTQSWASTIQINGSTGLCSFYKGIDINATSSGVGLEMPTYPETDTDTAATIIQNIQTGGVTFNDNDTSLMTAGAINDLIDRGDAAIASDTLTFTNKTFDANGSGNSLSNVEVADLAGTAIQTAAEVGDGFADNDTSLLTAAAIDDRINAADTSVHATVQTGKNYRILNCSFRDDIGTNKHYLPFKTEREDTVLTRAENSELAVMDGRVISVTLRAENLNTHSGDATVTFGVETNVVGTGYDNFTEIETEAITVNDTDDSHLWHAVFSEAKHWDSTDMFAISITSDTDISGSNERFFVTVVVEDDWSTYLAGSTREIDSTP